MTAPAAPVRIAVDLQVLQVPGAGAAEGVDPGLRAWVLEYALALARAGRLAAGLLAPALPPPAKEDLPEELLADGLLEWDTRATCRRLLDRGPLAWHVPAPYLHTGPFAPVGLVVSRHWAEAATLRVVNLPAAALPPAADPSSAARRELRRRWLGGADLVVSLSAHARCEVPAGRLLTPVRQGTIDAVAAAVVARLDGTSAGRGAPVGAAPGRTVATAAPAVAPAAAPAAAPATPPATPPAGPGLRVGLVPRIALFGPLPPAGGGLGAYNQRLLAALGGVVLTDAVVTRRASLPLRGHPGGSGAGAAMHFESFGVDINPASYDATVYTLGNSDGHLPTVESALRHPGWVWLHEARLPAVATTALQDRPDTEFADRMECLVRRAYPGRAAPGPVRAAGRSHLALAAAGVGLTALLAEGARGLLVNSEAARQSLLLDLPPLAATPPVVVLPPACPPVRGGDGRRTPAGRPLVGSFGVVSMAKRPDLLVDAVAAAGCRLVFVGPCPDVLRQVIDERAAARHAADRVEVAGAVGDEGWWDWLGRVDVAVQLRESPGGEMSAAVLDALAAGTPVLTNLDSTRDYPAGTVAWLPELSEAGIAASLTGLLGDRAALAELSEGAERFAAAHQMAGLAAALADAVIDPGR